MLPKADSIAAIATAPGRGGIGVVRVSGRNLDTLAIAILGKMPVARQASYAPFLDAQGQIIDQGIALFFPTPHSYTGEDVLELQGHGGTAVLQLILQRSAIFTTASIDLRFGFMSFLKMSITHSRRNRPAVA